MHARERSLRLPLVALGLVSSMASADPARDAAFRKAADRAAARRDQVVTRFYAANLDGDGREALVAEAWGKTDDESAQAGMVFVERADGTRSALELEKEQADDDEPVRAPGKPEAGKATSVEIDLGYRRERSVTDVAVREGALAVVNQHHSDFHIPDYYTETNVDWSTLVRQGEDGDYGDDKQADDPGPRPKSRRRDAVLLVGDTKTPTDTQIVRGKDAWTSAADASLAVHVREAQKRLVVDLAIDDDVHVDATARTEAALDAADHVALWAGKHALRLAHDASGWFVLGKDAAQVRVAMEGKMLTVDVPLSWASLRSSSLSVTAMTADGHDEAKTEAHGRVGSLVVAFADVDAPGGPRTVVSTAPVPKKGDPTGLLVALPDGARWPRATGDVKPVPFR